MQNMQQSMIKIEVEFLGQLSTIYKKISLEINANLKIHEIITILNISKSHINSLIIIRNDYVCNRSEQLENNDKLFITLPLGGG